jgi:hypothetical protein
MIQIDDSAPTRKVTWATGKRECDLSSDTWHYCSHYNGPQISKDVSVWPRRSHHIGAGSTISPEVEQPLRLGPRAPPRRGSSNWARCKWFLRRARCGRPQRERSRTKSEFVY